MSICQIHMGKYNAETTATSTEKKLQQATTTTLLRIQRIEHENIRECATLCVRARSHITYIYIYYIVYRAPYKFNITECDLNASS